MRILLRVPWLAPTDAPVGALVRSVTVAARQRRRREPPGTRR
jgi:hypothetical protein